MDKGWVPTLPAVVLVMMVAGCMGQPNAAEQSLQYAPATPISNQYSPQEASVEEGVGKNGADAPKPADEVSEAEETRALEPSAHAPEAAKLSIVVGDDVKLETTLEHETATFDGTEYTIEPYGVTFALRTDMGEPVVEGERIVFSTDLLGEATISYEVMENTSLNEAVDKELQDHEDSFYGEFVETTSKSGLKGKQNNFKDESVYAGVSFYEFDRHVLRIEFRSPMDAVDAMVRIVNETVDSVKM
ncbi:hypothetical protein [Cohnella thermotolerans]|uniref:hypothetical protein n=1 Tax=Cohnella thermotolerans TaxID=329858 RepID=UPI00042A9333|nr:hypothetical protein [Cohnella thermotolerans]